MRERFQLRVAGDLCVLDQRMGAQRLSFGGDPVPLTCLSCLRRARELAFPPNSTQPAPAAVREHQVDNVIYSTYTKYLTYVVRRRTIEIGSTLPPRKDP